MEIFNYILKYIEFDQLILEFVGEDGTGGWVHVSFVDGNNRGKVMKAKKVNGKTKYFNY